MNIPLMNGWRLTIAVRRYRRHTGISSALNDGRHFLMWDFDDIDDALVRKALTVIQWSFDLPDIVVMRTSERSYHAYCFEPYTWARCLAILAATPHLDVNYFKMGVMREYFTLRVSEKQGSVFGPVEVLAGDRRASLAERMEPLTFTQYETAKG